MMRVLYLLGIGVSGGRSNMRAEDMTLFFIYFFSFIVGGFLLYAGVKTFLKYNRRERESAAQPPKLDYSQPLKVGHTILTYFRILFVFTIGALVLGFQIKYPSTANIWLIIFLVIGMVIFFDFVKIIFSRLAITQDELIIKGVFGDNRIPMNDLVSIYLKSAYEPLGNTIGDVTVVFVAKDGRRYKWFCDSFKSLDRITEYVRHFVPGISIETSNSFKLNRGANDFLNKPLFQKKESDKGSKQI
ncbi:MAG TPA: hypothetical protein VJC37_09345 [Planctomycetota bacterium]|nr:hypothetical protein [Planctomycetota bacterium]